LHVCKMCRFYKESLRWECAETIEEHIIDKESRNHCEWFQVAGKFFSEGVGDNTRNDKSRNAKKDFEGLFKQ
jgi:hypothetical protein